MMTRISAGRLRRDSSPPVHDDQGVALGRWAAARLWGLTLSSILFWAAACVMATGLFHPPRLSAVTYPLRWRWSNPAPHGNNIINMVYSPFSGRAVQVTERGQIYTSEDLSLWIPRDSG